MLWRLQYKRKGERERGRDGEIEKRVFSSLIKLFILVNYMHHLESRVFNTTVMRFLHETGQSGGQINYDYTTSSYLDNNGTTAVSKSFSLYLQPRLAQISCFDFWCSFRASSLRSGFG